MIDENIIENHMENKRRKKKIKIQPSAVKLQKVKSINMCSTYNLQKCGTWVDNSSLKMYCEHLN